MNKETIPEDIQRKVAEVLGRPGERMGVDQYMGLSLRVGLAILAERERAAKAAEQRGKELREPAIGSDIANTIREPSSP